MNPIILPPAMGKIIGQTGVLQPWSGNSEFEPVKLHLKTVFVSYPARLEGLGKYGEFKL